MKEQPKKITPSSEVYSRQEYATANFWDDRYTQNGGMFDWYSQYPELKLPFSEYDIKVTDRILMVGCGNSQLSHQMWEAGYKDIVNIDISPKVIEQMAEKFPMMVWEVMDATKMSYKDAEFDVVMDKGTLDALVSGKNYDICGMMLKECMRVTKQHGQVILITYGSPEGRRKIFEPAYPFEKYDYYKCRAELNDMSTLINLMRNNVGPERALSHVMKDTQAFAKSMKEFSIIRYLRQKRKNKKEYILWSGIKKTELQVNHAYEQLPTQKKQKTQKKEEPVQNKQQNTEKEPKDDKTKKEESAKKEPPVTYNPQKQSYVWVYSIKRKFAVDLEEQIGEATQQSLKDYFKVNESLECDILSDEEVHPYTIYLREDYFGDVLKGVKYLQKKEISFPSLRISNNINSSLPQSMRINLLDASSTKIMVLRKTNVIAKLPFDDVAQLPLFLKELQKLGPKLVSECNLYPCPKTYALFNVMKNRMGKTVNFLLEKYWFPTVKFLSFENNVLTFKISLPPVVKEKQDEIVAELHKILKKKKIQFQSHQTGCISYFDLGLSNVVGMACLCQANTKMEMIFEEFWEEDQVYQKMGPDYFTKDEKYNCMKTTFAIPRGHMAKIVTHILAFY